MTTLLSPRTRRLLAFALTAGLSLTLARAALAGEVTLKSDIADADGRVTLGELFDGAGAAQDVVIATRVGPTAVLAAADVQSAAHRYGLEWANPQGIRRIIVRGGAVSAAVTGAHNVQVLTFAHSLAAGQIVQPEDLIWAKAAGAPADAPRDADAVIGMAARRPVPEGASVSMRDVSAPIVIKAGDMVSVVYDDDGIHLTLTAKAMSNAAAGDSFNVQNTASKKIIEAVATGPGAAIVGPEANRMRTSRSPAAYSLR